MGERVCVCVPTCFISYSELNMCFRFCVNDSVDSQVSITLTCQEYITAVVCCRWDKIEVVRGGGGERIGAGREGGRGRSGGGRKERRRKGEGSGRVGEGEREKGG